MKFVEIKLSSIKKNADAGSTTTSVLTSKDTSFEVIGVFPDCLNNNEHVIITEQGRINGIDASYVTRGYIVILDDVLIENIKKARKEKNNFSINISTTFNRANIFHGPISKYSYEYENIDIECTRCHKTTKLNDIEEDEIDDYLVEICPHCNGVNTFEERKYQKIEAIKS